MADGQHRSPNAVLEQSAAPKLNLAKLRSLARPGLDPRTFVRSFSTSEIIAVVGLILMIVAAILVYSFGILPDQVARVQAQNEVEANEARKTELRQQVDDPSAIRDEFVRVQDSLNRFRGEMLKPRLAGRLEIIDAVDRISRETGVRLTSPVTFTTAMPAGPSERRREDEKSKVRSFPALGLSLTINGQYEQVRNFISRFEASRQFVVIDKVSIGIESEAEGEGALRRAPQTGPRPVDLEIEMTAYFQPDVALEPVP